MSKRASFPHSNVGFGSLVSAATKQRSLTALNAVSTGGTAFLRLSYAYDGKKQKALAGLWLWGSLAVLVCSTMASAAVLIGHLNKSAHMVRRRVG